MVIGRNALKEDPAAAARLEAYVRAGGRAVIFAQDPEWMARALGWRVCPQVSRARLPHEFPDHSTAIDADDLRNWTGSSTLIVGGLPGKNTVRRRLPPHGTSPETKGISLTPAGIGATAAR